MDWSSAKWPLPGARRFTTSARPSSGVSRKPKRRPRSDGGPESSRDFQRESMDVTLLRQPPDSVETDALIVIVSEETRPALSAACDALVARFYESGEFKGAPGEHILIHAPAGLKAGRLLLIGAGKSP